MGTGSFFTLVTEAPVREGKWVDVAVRYHTQLEIVVDGSVMGAAPVPAELLTPKRKDTRTVSAVVESDHPYPTSGEITYPVSLPGAREMTISFDPASAIGPEVWRVFVPPPSPPPRPSISFTQCTPS
jgi:hypothetical protein